MILISIFFKNISDLIFFDPFRFSSFSSFYFFSVSPMLSTTTIAPAVEDPGVSPTNNTKRTRDTDSAPASKGTVRPHRLDCDEFWDLCDKISVLELDNGEKPVEFSVYVKTLTGKSIVLAITVNTTIRQLMQQIQDTEGIPPDQQRLIHNGQQLLDEQLSASRDYHVMPEATLHLVLRLRGGMFAESSGRYVDGFGRPIVSDSEDPPELIRVQVYTDRMQQQEAWIPVCMIRYQVRDLMDAVRKAVGPRAYLNGPIVVGTGPRGTSFVKKSEDPKTPPARKVFITDLGVKPGCLIKFLKM